MYVTHIIMCASLRKRLRLLAHWTYRKYRATKGDKMYKPMSTTKSVRYISASQFYRYEYTSLSYLVKSA